MRLFDSGQHYGWISIALHWITGAAVLSLWFAGDSLGIERGPAFDSTLRIHTTIALCAYAFLLGRVVWRLKLGHPQKLPTQGKLFFAVGTATHYVMLLFISVMIVTGPLLAWAGGLPLRFFNMRIPAPFSPNPELFEWLRHTHAFSASALMIAVLLHIGGVFIHMAIPRDGTFDRMMTPGKRSARNASPSP